MGTCDNPKRVSRTHRIVTTSQGGEPSLGTPDRHNSLNFPSFNIVGSNQDDGSHVILPGIGHMNRLLAFLGSLCELRIHRDRQPFIRLFLKHGKGPYRLLIGHPRNHSI